MTQSFVGTREQVLSALMHATSFSDNGGILDCVRFARPHARLPFGVGPDSIGAGQPSPPLA